MSSRDYALAVLHGPTAQDEPISTNMPERPSVGRSQSDILIVGGGVTGCATAWNLAKHGADVLLLEQHDINTQASGRNAGSLHGQIQHEPFVERGEEWARKFLPSLDFLSRSLEMWNGLSKDLDTELEVTLHGGLLVAETTEQMRDIERKVMIERSIGVESDVLNASDLQKTAPYISSSMVGAQLTRVEGKANPLLAAPAFAQAASERGARILTNTRVETIRGFDRGFEVSTDSGVFEANRVILATGNSTNAFSYLWGNSLPLTDEPVQVSATEPIAPMVRNLVYFAGGRLTFKQAKAGSLLIGGGWPSDIDRTTGYPRVNPHSLRSNMAVALHVVPSLAGVQLIRTWAGVGIATPDLAPIIGQLSAHLFVGIFPHMGLTAGPLMGQILAQMATDVRPEINLAPFAVDRF